MPPASKSLKIAQRLTKMDSVQDAFRALLSKMASASKKSVISPFVWHSTLTKQSASPAPKDRISSRDVVTRSMATAHSGSQALENARHATRDTS